MTDLSSCFNNPCWHPKFRNCCCCCCCNSVSISFRCGSPVAQYAPGCDCCQGETTWEWMDLFGIFVWVAQDSTCTEGCISTSPDSDGVIEGEIAYTPCNPTPAFRALSTTQTGDCKWVWSGSYWDLPPSDFRCKPGFNCIMPTIDGSFIGEIQYTSCVRTEEINYFDIIPPQNFPEFDNETITSSDNVFAFSADSCSVPCTNVTVTLHATCCVSCDDNIITAIGNGTITGDLSPTSLTGCDDLELRVNGSTLPYAAVDGEILNVTITPEQTCCCCTQVSCSDPCGVTPVYYMKSGVLHLSKQSLINKISDVKEKQTRITAYRTARSHKKQKYILQLRDLKRGQKKPTKRDIRLL